MTTKEIEYWESEFSDSELNKQADIADCRMAVSQRIAEIMINANREIEELQDYYLQFIKNLED